MKMLALNNNYDNNSNNNKVKEDENEDGDGDEDKGKNGGDSFAERAEAYYEERPQLLSLLRDLYNCYLSLADRYCQTLAKHHRHLHQHHHHHHRRQRSSPITIKPDLVHFEESDNFSDCHKEEEENGNSDAESSLSYQQPSTLAIQNPNVGAGDHGSNTIVVELVMKMVEYDIVANEVEEERQRWREWWRKIELQKSLVEVLESERMILLNENARLGYKVMAVVEENKSLVAETVFVKRKAAEMARCLFKMREDHRVSLLTCKIQDLQAQIYGLERTRNNEEDLIANSSNSSSSSNSNGSHGSDHDAAADSGGRRRRRRRSSSVKKVSKWWWSRVKSFDLLIPARMCTDAT